MFKNSVNLKSFHRELNDGNLLKAYEIATFLKEKYINYGGPLTVLNYLNKFIDEYEIKVSKKINKTTKSIKEKENLNNLYQWNYIKSFFSENISKVCEISCSLLTLNDSNLILPNLVSEEWENFFITKNKYLELFDGWYSSTHKISLRINFFIEKHYYLEVLQPSFSKFGYLESLKKQTIKNKESLLDIYLKNPFLPLYFLLYENKEVISKVFCLPFPSLLRSGMHYSELLFSKPNLNLKSAITSYSYELLNNIIDSNKQNGINSENRRSIIIDEEFLDSYDIFNFFKALKINYKDYRLVDKKTDFYENIVPNLKNLTNFVLPNKENFNDYTLLINSFDFTPLYILSNPFFSKKSNNPGDKNNAEDKKFSFNIKCYYPHENNFENNETFSKEFGVYLEKNKNHSNLIKIESNLPEINLECTVIICDVSCEHKLLLAIHSLLEQKFINIQNIIILEEEISASKIRNVIKNLDNLPEKIIIFNFVQLLNFFKKIESNSKQKMIFLSSRLIFNNKLTIAYLIDLLDKSEGVSNISCGINTYQNYISGSVKRNNKFGLQINIPNSLNNNHIELTEIDLNLNSFIKEIYPIINNKYFCIWDFKHLNKYSLNIRDCNNIEDLLISLSIYSVLGNRHSKCLTLVLLSFQDNPSDNLRYFISRDISNLILSNFNLFYKLTTRISGFNI